MTASEMYVKSQGSSCDGDLECYWCKAPCDRSWMHKEYISATRSHTTPMAKKPESPYICNGCRLFRRERITIHWFGGSYLDGQCPMNHSWVITPSWSRAIQSPTEVYSLMLQPPKVCSISLLNNAEEQHQNHLQYMKVNKFDEIRETTELTFGVNGCIMGYCVGELQQGIDGVEGVSGGVRELLKAFPAPDRFKTPKRKPGRPPTKKGPDATVVTK